MPNSNSEILSNATIENSSSNIVVFDIETQKGFSEVSTIQDMRVAIAVSYNYLNQDYNVYTENDVDKLIQELFNADAVVGYNILNFDYAVLARYTNQRFNSIKSIDMMKIVQENLGFRPKLDNLISATFRETKSADGLQSLKWFKQGKIELIKEYCIKDVELTKKLYDFGKENGFVFAINKNGQKTIVPVKW